MNLKTILIIAGCSYIFPATAQERTMELSLDETVKLAKLQSPDAQTARHSFRSAYWNYKYYRANYLPALSLTSDPNLNRAINKVTLGDGTVKFVEQNMLSTDLTLNLTQNIPWTGGSLFVETAAQRMDIFSDHTTAWQTSPINIGYRQSLFGYNSLKWDRRIEPVRYREAKKSYVETLELVATRATQKFFNLATAQSNYETATTNYANADTLYQYAQGRYNIGTITENEMLQLELNKLTEETNRMNARIEMDNCMQELRSYLGIQSDEELKVKINDHVPDFSVTARSLITGQRKQSGNTKHDTPETGERKQRVIRPCQCRTESGYLSAFRPDTNCRQAGKRLQEAIGPAVRQPECSTTHPRLGTGQGQSARGTLQPRPCVHTGGTRQDRFRTKHTQTGETI